MHGYIIFIIFSVTIIVQHENAQLCPNLTDLVSLIITEIPMVELEIRTPCISSVHHDFYFNITHELKTSKGRKKKSKVDNEASVKTIKDDLDQEDEDYVNGDLESNYDICSTVSYGDTQYTPNIPTRSNCPESRHHHHHDHSHEHSHSQVERTYPNWHTQDMTDRSPRSTNSNTKPITDSKYHHSETMLFNITLAPYPLLNTNTRKITQDPNTVKSHRQHGETDVRWNLRLDTDSKSIVNINIIREVFFGNFTGNVHTDDSKMIFPVDKISHTTRKISSRNCTHGLCEVVDDYPGDKINSIVSRSKELRQYFEQMEVPAQIDFNNRFGEDGDPLCSTVKYTRFPKSAKNTKDVELLLVNDGEYKQGVIYETCANEDKPCGYSEIFPMGYSTTCKQKYTVRRLMAIAEGSDNPAFDNFPMPACCICTVKKTV